LIDEGDDCMTWGKSAIVTLHQQSRSMYRPTGYLYIGVPALYVTIAHS